MTKSTAKSCPYALVLRDDDAISDQQIIFLKKRIPKLKIYSIHSKKVNDVITIPHLRQPVRTNYENYLTECVYFFLKEQGHRKIFFWSCGELAEACVRAKYFMLDFAKCEFAVGENLSKSLSTEQSFTISKTLFFSNHLRASEEMSVIDFFRGSFLDKNLPPLQEPQNLTLAITHKNRWSFLKEALQSFEKQSFKGFEILIGDDGSDPCDEMIQFPEWLKQNISLPVQFIPFNSSKGPGARRNTLTRMARTAYIAFFDDDNIAHPEMMGTWAQLTKFPLFDAFTCAYDSFQIVDGKISQCSDVSFSLYEDARSKSNCYGDSASLFKVQSLIAVGGFSEKKTDLFEDWQLFLKMKKMGLHIQSIPLRLFSYRHHEQQRSYHGEIPENFKNLLPPRLDDAKKGWDRYVSPKL